MMRIYPDSFRSLVAHFRDTGLLKDSMHIDVEEKLAIFMHIIAHKMSNRAANSRYGGGGDNNEDVDEELPPNAILFGADEREASIVLRDMIAAELALAHNAQNVSSRAPVTVMALAPSKQYSDDVSLLVVLLDCNPFFWGGVKPSISFSSYLTQVLSFLNSILLLNQLNQVVVIATGVNSCDYVYDSSVPQATLEYVDDGRMPALCANFLQKLEEFMIKDEQLSEDKYPDGILSSLLSGSLSLALCYIQRVFRSGPRHPQPRFGELLKIYFTVLLIYDHRFYACKDIQMDLSSTFFHDFMDHSILFQSSTLLERLSWQIRSRDECNIFSSAFHGIYRFMRYRNSEFSLTATGVLDITLASYITGGIYMKPELLDGLFQYLEVSFLTIFATDLMSRSFLQLPKPIGVDFRASVDVLLAAQGGCLEVSGAFVIKRQLTWPTSVQFVCLFSANMKRNVRLVGHAFKAESNTLQLEPVLSVRTLRGM
ncbi:hypothetical protein GIB67_039636 [Kingdonia uniflora]|uniref:General transcription and DNA repair factor IIH subunit TFB4 n=1 Tax=Kingdonia uniflora TaxID=39325 RepID=A0A7J7MDC6_9MAGN|nr:hypothetical protein GIB67_039636 [Kingdonia uniflora]